MCYFSFLFLPSFFFGFFFFYFFFLISSSSFCEAPDSKQSECPLGRGRAGFEGLKPPRLSERGAPRQSRSARPQHSERDRQAVGSAGWKQALRAGPGKGCQGAAAHLRRGSGKEGAGLAVPRQEYSKKRGGKSCKINKIGSVAPLKTC